MKTSTNALLIAATLLSAAGLSAQTPAPAEAPSASWVITPSVVSQYMFRGVRLGGPSFQPSAEYDNGNLAVGIWSSVPLKDRVPGQSAPEIDPYGSYKFVVNDAFNVQPGFTLYTYPRADTNNGFYKLTFEPNIAANYTIGGLTLTPKLYYDLIVKGPTAEMNAAYALPLKDLGTEIDFSASVGTYKWTDAVKNSVPDTKNWGDYWLVGASMPYQVTKTSKLVLGFAYTKGSKNFYKQGTDPRSENTAAVGRGVVTLSYSITF